MFELGNRNTAITIITEILVFAAWALGSAFGWDKIEWVVGAIAAVVAASVFRARGEYRLRADTATEPEPAPVTFDPALWERDAEPEPGDDDQGALPIDE
jgi:hypothetical protein